MFLQTKIAINCCHQVRFLGCRYTKNALAAPDPSGGAYSAPQTPTRYLSLCLNIAGLRQSPGMLLGSWKVVEFCVTKRVGALLYGVRVV